MINITDLREMKARIIVFGVGGAGGNAVNNMIAAGLQGVDRIKAMRHSWQKPACVHSAHRRQAAAEKSWCSVRVMIHGLPWSRSACELAWRAGAVVIHAVSSKVSIDLVTPGKVTAVAGR
jgi:hypothetical protein